MSNTTQTPKKSTSERQNSRFWEIDCLRTLAIGAMILFHFFYIFNYLYLISVPIHQGFWWIFPRIIAAGFILLMGISLTLSYNRRRRSSLTTNLFTGFFCRALKLLAIALVITLITWFVFKESLVLFGVLHLIGVSILLTYPLLRFKYINLLLGLAILGGGLILGKYQFDFFGLLWLGFRPGSYYPVDYLPLFPWLAFALLGIFLGNWFYPRGIRRWELPNLSRNPLIRILSFPGRHSLIFYLAHLPLLYGIGILITILMGG